MVIETKQLKTASGHPVLRANFQGDITVADARGYHESVIPGGRFERHGHLVVGNISGVSADVKKVLSSRAPDPKNPDPVAIVLESALARMAAGLALRLTNNENTEFFKSEADALAWLDERMTEYVRKLRGG